MPYLSVTETAYPTTVVEATTYASITDGEITLTVQIPGTESVSVTTATAAGVNDHGGLTGLGDDDHTIYSLVDGTRAFTAVVTGVAPSSDLHLSTKKYVDDKTWTESDITDLDHTVDVVSNVAQDRLLGRTAAGSGNSEELTQAASLTFLGV